MITLCNLRLQMLIQLTAEHLQVQRPGLGPRLAEPFVRLVGQSDDPRRRRERLAAGLRQKGLFRRLTAANLQGRSGVNLINFFSL